jgi:hypothetical protein
MHMSDTEIFGVDVLVLDSNVNQIPEGVLFKPLYAVLILERSI